jgi:hypothetical protein
MRLILDRPPPKQFIEAARDHSIQVQTGTSFLNDLIDSTKIARQVLDDGRIKETAEQYVEQHVNDEEGDRLSDASSTYVLKEWLDAPGKSLLAILAQAGHGKTSLMRVLARALALAHQHNPESPVPLLIPFADYRTLQDFRGLILRRLEDARVLFTSAGFERLLAEGRAVLLLDGFDELSEEAGYEVSRQNLRQLSEHIAGSGARVIITSRSAFFRTSRELSDAILRDFEQEAITVVELAEFTSQQQREYLRRSGYADPQVDRIVGRIASEPSLRELSGSPLLLSLIADSAGEGRVGSRPQLYSSFLTSVYARERERYGYELTDEVQLGFLSDVAQDMYKDNTFVYDKADLQTFFAEPAVEHLVQLAPDTDLARVQLVEKLSNHAVLDSVAGGNQVRFRHPTFREYLVAGWFAGLARQNHKVDLDIALGRRRMPDGVAEFLVEMIDDDCTTLLCDVGLQQGEIGAWNAVKIASYRAMALGGLDETVASDAFTKALAGRLNFDQQDLRELRFRRLDLSAASFRAANLEDAFFDRCQLRGVDLSRAVLKQTALVKCDLREARFDDASTLLSIKVDEGEDHLIETDQGVRQWLADQGAHVDRTDLIERVDGKSSRQLGEELVRHVFRRFYRVGRRFWDPDLDRETLLRGLSGRERRLTHRDVIPILRNEGFFEEKRERGHTLVTFNPVLKPEVEEYLDAHRPSDRIIRAVQRVIEAIE